MELLWYTEYSGDDWQGVCDILLSLKHGPCYQSISDKGGDDGLDGVVLGQGIAYQVYGQEPDNRDPVKGVKDKIHTDLNKLKNNKDDLEKYFTDRKLSSWVLLLNKEIPHNTLNSYAITKRNEVLSWSLPFIADDFQVAIQTPSYLTTEHLEYKKRKDERIEIHAPALPAPSKDDIKKNEQFIAVFGKFQKITDDTSAEDLAYNEIKSFLDGSIYIDEIRKAEPEFYKEIEEVRSDVEAEANDGSMMNGSYDSYAHTKTTLEARLNNKIGTRLGANTLNRVRKFIIADWFVRCPLNFKNKNTPK